ncbi:hypothetical protein AOX63_19270 [Pseudomonas sp. ADP]|nr:hypothetical protein AOX63_19270 [Pseudomonas sp. ADP]
MPEGKRGFLHKVILWMSRRQGKSKEDMTVISTLLRLGPLAPRYLLFVSNLLFKGGISRQDKERVILRVAWRTGSVYEWAHHVALGLDAGLSREEIDSFGQDDSPLWTPRTRAFVQAIDELHVRQSLGEEKWRELALFLSEDLCVEFLVLVGHYVMAATMLNTLGVRLEPEFSIGKLPPPVSR